MAFQKGWKSLAWPRRTVALAACAAFLFLGALVANRLTPDNRSENQKKYDRIRVGMTMDQVEAVLGGPPGFYNRPQPIINMVGKENRDGSGATFWDLPDVYIAVGYDKNKVVIEKWCNPPPPPVSPTSLQRAWDYVKAAWPY
jgi:hypothetical protein